MVVFPFSLSLDRQLSYDNSCLVVLVVVASMLEYCTVVYYVQLVKSLLVGYGWFSLCGRSSWYDTIRYRTVFGMDTTIKSKRSLRHKKIRDGFSRAPGKKMRIDCISLTFVYFETSCWGHIGHHSRGSMICNGRYRRSGQILSQKGDLVR